MLDKVKNKSYEKLMTAARDLFSEKWYETVSVVEICRRAGLSNGVFYRYFKNKEDIFLKLLNEIVIYYEEGFSTISGKSFEDRMDRFLDTVVKSGVGDYKKDVLIYREGQYRYPKYEQHLRDLYGKGVSLVLLRETSQAEQLFISGIARFVIIRYIFNGLSYDKTKIKKIITNGIFYDEIKNYSLIFDEEDVIYPDIPEDESARSKLLSSGIELFGTQGYYKTDVHDITRNAGYSVGTFYLYFESKEAFLEEIVKIIGKMTRRFLTINQKKQLNRAENELRGIYLFLKYFESNSEYYKIVRESEFIVKKAANDYYDRFEKGYVENLERTKIEDKKLIANSLMGVSHYTGIDRIFLKRIKDIKSVLKELSIYLTHGIRI
ncbi:TetR/AcrR family transcriptional regulator [Petrotoga mobilis]|uniref:TetR/AcrR family transcriptional regulator n=1 Tax=Petrotoga mobilis TaxID=69499 RepID=UPI0003263594|nr:TetR/AcrR family transcriptional regulator [Petrotoga mobilis]